MILTPGEQILGYSRVRVVIVSNTLLFGILVFFYIFNMKSCPTSTGRIGFKTLKNPEELHGIGMRSIQYVVGKYHGILKWECRENLFITDITMYL